MPTVLVQNAIFVVFSRKVNNVVIESNNVVTFNPAAALKLLYFNFDFNESKTFDILRKRLTGNRVSVTTFFVFSSNLRYFPMLEEYEWIEND